jgi:hypothetical protein
MLSLPMLIEGIEISSIKIKIKTGCDKFGTRNDTGYRR